MHPSPNILHPSPNVTHKEFKGKMTKKVVRNSENVDIFGGPRTETKFVKWSATRKRLRTAALDEFGTIGQRTIGQDYDWSTDDWSRGRLVKGRLVKRLFTNHPL